MNCCNSQRTLNDQIQMNLGYSALEEVKDCRYESVTSQLFKKQNEEITSQLSVFQERLIAFAKEHNNDLKQNPDLKIKFLRMCSRIGIDPITLFDRQRHLFDVNDFYYEICLKVIEICRITKDLNGGIISFEELLEGFPTAKIAMEDLEKSVDMLQTLNGGFDIILIKGKKCLRSVPTELTSDQTKILEVCSVLGYASASLLRVNLGWTQYRSNAILEEMVAIGLLWIDEQAVGETLFWDPAWIHHSDIGI
ncbi:LAMI_0F12926g1_1 [Lachancea mirantina]|uniref:Vacuolar-sorting protein SNF8 n=1 Tax=Lachancea mirantina TaxID=1230905 RepID=A0A1G4K344_9SACH|nr:LAMI_0F12926g1_1 [Lachancea mirantina]